jgi:hypothetical protein
MLDFFVTVWRVNQDLPPEQRLRIVLADMERPWKDIQKREDWNKYDVNRDKFMAEKVLADLKKRPEDPRHALFIVGFAHAGLDLKHTEGGTPLEKAGWHLRQTLGTQV